MSTQSTRLMPEQTDNSSQIPAYLDGLGILIVDDQIDHLELMKEILIAAGYGEVFTAHNGTDALEILEAEKHVGLVLLDLVMPGMDGYAVCKQIRSNPATEDVCIIVVTGGAIQVEAALLKSFEAGANDFISKPLNRYDLLARSKSALTLYHDKQQNLYQELELVQREERYRSLFENSVDGIFVLNLQDLVIRDLNPAAEKIFGFEKDELIDRAFTSLCPKNSIPENYRQVSALFEGESLSLETQKINGNGDLLTVEIKFSGYQIQGETKIMAVVSDISPRILADKDLRTSEERLSLAVMDSDNGIWDWDIVNGDIYFSDNWRKFLGLTKTDEPLGLEVWKAHLHPEESDRVLQSMRNHWKQESRNFMEEHRLLGKSGKYRWVLSRGKAIWNDAGEVIRMAGSLTDITEKKLLESQVIQMQKMEGLDRFAGGVAHDLQSMVTVVNSYSSFIEDAVPNHTAVAQYLGEIRKATEHSSSLVKQLMAFSRKHQIQLEYVFLNLEIKNLLNMVKSVINDKIELVTEIEEDLPPVLADHTMISQILLNLVLNCRDAMPEGGALTIGTTLHHLEESFFYDDREIASGDYLKLSVGDTGVGMDDSIVEQVFEPFFTTKNNEDGHSGTGLGLSTVYGIIKQHRGWISIKSRPAIGTRFDLFFPVLNEADSNA